MAANFFLFIFAGSRAVVGSIKHGAWCRKTWYTCTRARRRPMFLLLVAERDINCPPSLSPAPTSLFPSLPLSLAQPPHHFPQPPSLPPPHPAFARIRVNDTVFAPVRRLGVLYCMHVCRSLGAWARKRGRLSWPPRGRLSWPT